jgi:alpha-ketoglutarate-dependent taurine dioxygenase
MIPPLRRKELFRKRLTSTIMPASGGRAQMTSVAEKISAISVAKLHPVIGAEIGGVDLRYPLGQETIRRIKEAWHRHTVLVFRDQDLSEDDQRRFASYFGPVAKRVRPPSPTTKRDGPDWDEMMLITDNVDADG